MSKYQVTLNVQSPYEVSKVFSNKRKAKKAYKQLCKLYSSHAIQFYDLVANKQIAQINYIA